MKVLSVITVSLLTVVGIAHTVDQDATRQWGAVYRTPAPDERMFGSAEGVSQESVGVTSSKSVEFGIVTLSAATSAKQNQILRRDQFAQGVLIPGDRTLDDGSFYDVWTYPGQAGEQIAIELISHAFDAYLLVTDPVGDVIAEDDDGGVGTSSSVSLGLELDGSYLIIANTVGAEEVGAYTLTVAPTRRSVGECAKLS